MKYLYHYGDYSDYSVYRKLVKKETEHFFTLDNGDRISKKKMILNRTSWLITRFYLETPELLAKFELNHLQRHVKSISRQLHNIQNINALVEIMNIAKREKLLELNPNARSER